MVSNARYIDWKEWRRRLLLLLLLLTCRNVGWKCRYMKGGTPHILSESPKMCAAKAFRDIGERSRSLR
uniref:Putative secreted protein n=1 Tax=Anopheles darlingi TaxID=43151 RepID=A0A2M4DNY7_ANODA